MDQAADAPSVARRADGQSETKTVAPDAWLTMTDAERRSFGPIRGYRPRDPATPFLCRKGDGDGGWSYLEEYRAWIGWGIEASAPNKFYLSLNIYGSYRVGNIDLFPNPVGISIYGILSGAPILKYYNTDRPAVAMAPSEPLAVMLRQAIEGCRNIKNGIREAQDATSRREAELRILPQRQQTKEIGDYVCDFNDSSRGYVVSKHGDKLEVRMHIHNPGGLYTPGYDYDQLISVKSFDVRLCDQ